MGFLRRRGLCVCMCGGWGGGTFVRLLTKLLSSKMLESYFSMRASFSGFAWLVSPWCVNHGVCQNSAFYGCMRIECDLLRLHLCTGPSAVCQHLWCVAGAVHHKAGVCHQLGLRGCRSIWMHRYPFSACLFEYLPLCSSVDCCATCRKPGVFFTPLFGTLHVLHTFFLSQCSSRVSMATWGCFQRDIRKALWQEKVRLQNCIQLYRLPLSCTKYTLLSTAPVVALVRELFLPYHTE